MNIVIEEQETQQYPQEKTEEDINFEEGKRQLKIGRE